ncbi:MAG: 30S ribosomal protein S27ae [Candidatus Bathyarchaeales archaeon]
MVKDGKVTRSNPFCPRCGAGVFMADRGDWWSCGKWRQIQQEGF